MADHDHDQDLGVLFIILDKTKEEDTETLIHLYGPLLTYIGRNCRVHDVRCSYDAIQALSLPNTWKAVVLVEPMIVGTRFQALSDKVLSFAKNGGRVIFEGRFGRLLRPQDLNAYFENVWKLPWRYGALSMEEWEYAFNPTCIMKRMGEHNQELPRLYKFQGLQLANVAVQDTVYLPKWPQQANKELHKGPTLVSGGCVLEKSDNERWMLLAPIAFSKYERGWVGWVGDDKPGYKPWTVEVVAAMCGI